MASLKQIKNRIKSVRSTKKVTKTMELISAIKLQKAVDYALNVKKYINELNVVAERVDIKATNLKRFRTESSNNLLVIVSSDRGLAGSYIGNLRRFLQEYFKNHGKPEQVILVGKKLFGYLKKENLSVDAVYKYSEFSDLERLSNLIFQNIIDKINNNLIGSARIVYTKFHNISKQTIELEDLLPEIDENIENIEQFETVDIESSINEVEEYLSSEVIRVSIHSAIAGAVASEHLNRMIAMKNATEASQEIIDALQLVYNKTRQSNITREIIEIISGMQNEAEVDYTTSINKIKLNLI